MPENQYNFDELTREMVTSQLKGAPDAAHRAAEIARETIVAGIKGTKGAQAKQSPAETVRLICRGAIAGLLLLEGDLPKASVEILNQLTAASNDTGIEASEMMTWAMQGIADNAGVMSAAQVRATHVAIDAAFMGAGAIFGEMAHETGS